MTRKLLTIVTTTDPKTLEIKALAQQLGNLHLPPGWGLELIVVDDLSLWRDAEHAAMTLKTWTPVHIRSCAVWYPERRGQLAALIAGARASSGDAVLTIDPDMHHCCSQIPSMMAGLINGHHIVVHGQRRSRHDASLLRRASSKVMNLIVRWLSGVHVPDLGSPVMLFSSQLLDELELAVSAGAHPRLYLYRKYQPRLKIVTLETDAIPAHQSHYDLRTLWTAATTLIRQSIVSRRYYPAPPTLISDHSEQ